MLISVIAGLAVSATAASGLTAETYPSRPIQMIVPSPTGGGTDLAARVLAEAAESFLQQKVVVENKPGGGGTVGVALVTQARPDGYTLAAVWNSPLTASPQTLQVPYTHEDYTPILMLSWSSYVLCASPAFPAETAEEMVAHLKSRPNAYTYGNDGVGGTMQLAAERIFRALGVQVRPVPFGGAGETLKNFLGDHVDFYGGSIPPVLPHAKAGKAKCLLVTSAERNAALPSAAGLADLGIPETATVLWRAIIGPKGMPPDTVAIVEKAFRQAAQSEKFRTFLAQQGEELKLAGPDELKQIIVAEDTALGEVAAALKQAEK
jgi:tripartite-type tricarboxylate transporter receptor subunit TctC